MVWGWGCSTGGAAGCARGAEELVGQRLEEGPVWDSCFIDQEQWVDADSDAFTPLRFNFLCTEDLPHAEPA